MFLNLQDEEQLSCLFQWSDIGQRFEYKSCICFIIRSKTNIDTIVKQKQITWFKYLFWVSIKYGVSVMSQATAEANNLSAVAASKETYHQLMEAVCGGAKPYLSTAHLESEHFRIKDKSMELFTKKPKMGGEEFSRQYKEKLDQVRKLSLLRISYFVLWYLQNKGVYNFVSA